ncbi:carboxylating nicotinate-nucleotide diphosphorylase [Aureliella helgolandensis]|uniref:Probable nicotinate-nucleotide pyrophosphorylase [carboxylating] n=1 Tax=Aureliella helgolandensis TaxID=2527968 RepID=A0A518G0L9_9BACT|nr:carboxylating nicotinate-nucleotide diphosphorylase [Aureliella helgolandensis]QDV22148.1 Nicotinate-nucleotide pyrophosphorylase [carboxylating] [Aureliella helgolandensis]
MLENHQDFAQQTRDEFLRDDLEQLVRLAIREDLSRGFDLTTISVVPEGLTAQAAIVAREPGIASGVELIPWIIETIGADIPVQLHRRDGEKFTVGDPLATLRGEARDVLTCERTILNFLGRLCGIASWTKEHVDVISGLKAQLYDTRKTTPGWRRLEKYAVACGGGRNHRSGLYDAILIKDNHLACHQSVTGKLLSPSEAIAHARQFLAEQVDAPAGAIVEIEVDTLEQLADALQSNPDIVLLDNMTNDQLSEAVRIRDQQNASVQLEASGGVRLETLRGIAETGVDRISVGALTHSAVNLDLGLDWTL